MSTALTPRNRIADDLLDQVLGSLGRKPRYRPERDLNSSQLGERLDAATTVAKKVLEMCCGEQYAALSPGEQSKQFEKLFDQFDSRTLALAVDGFKRWSWLAGPLAVMVQEVPVG